MFARFVRVMTSVFVVASLAAAGARAQQPAGGGAGPLCTGCTTYHVTVTPQAGVVGSYLSSSHDTLVFTVTNDGQELDHYTLSCSATGGVSCTSVSATSLRLGNGTSAPDTVVYSLGTSPGLIELTAVGSFGTPPASSTGYDTVTAQPTVTIQAPVASAGRAVVHNRQPVLRAVFATNGSPLDTTKTLLIWRADTVTTFHADTLSTARVNHGLVEWEVDSARELGLPDSAQMTVKACALNGLCSTVSEWVVLLADHKPVLDLTTLPLETPGAAFGAPFGPGLAVSGGDVGTGFSTPAYTSWGASRSAGLVYSTRTSYPRALIPVNVELPWPNGSATKLHVTLFDGATRLDSVVVSSPSCQTGSVKRCRVGLQANFASGSYATPTRKWLTVQVQVDSGATTNLATDSVEVVVVDRRHAIYGSGWWPAGVSQLVSAGSDRVLVGADGSATIFRGVADSVYLAPPGVFTTLVKVGSTWELHPRGTQAKVVFDSNGRVVRTVDPHGNADSVVYSGTSTQVTALADPLGHRITFGYTGGGLLASLTDPGSRVTKVVIDGSNHLVADTIPSANSHTYFTSFAYHLYSDSGLVLTTRTGVLGDATTVTYDSTFTRRPTKVTLASVDTGGGSASPVIQYAAAEAQGFHTLDSTNAVTVTVTDPKLHWTTSQVNRWGAALKTWDVLDTLARARYTAEGLVKWTEGKIRDSSRVTTGYDALRRPFKSYVIRAGNILRLDSLVYDTASRVVTSVDARGKASQIVYDSYGDVTQTIDPNADTSRVWFGSTGHVDSTRASGDTASTRYHYEGTWQNVDSVVDPSGALVARYFYDGLGRDTATDAKVQVQVVTGSFNWQWRRTEAFFNPISQPDSTRTLRTATCTGSCDTPPSWPSPSDTTATMRVAFRYDHAGRDSLRIGDRYAEAGDSTGVLYVYDILGRLRSRHPWWGSASRAVRDSFVVDVAGNVKKTITRRGDTLTTAFDSRNRDTSTVIPGVGTLRHIYAGPADQLSREAYTGLVDSIGGINPTRAWVYDSSGRLKSDTGFTGSTARVTSYLYDHLDRDSLTTDPVGTAQIRYESVRGIVDTVIAATGDTIVYGLDGQGRPVTGSARPGSHTAMTVAWTWNVTHDLASIARGAQDPTGAGFDPGSWYKKPKLFPQGEQGATFLGPIWTQQPNPSFAADTLADTVAYDGWQRVTSWYELKDNTLTAIETYTFDRDGNLGSGASEAYDALTDRLSSRTDACGTWIYTYDNAGNLTQGTCGGHSWTYTYDALNALRSVRYDGTLIARYAYDAEGRRIAKDVYSSATGGTVQCLLFYYHGANVAFETNCTGTIGNRYAWTGTDQLAAYTDASGHRHTVVTDLLGSVRAQFVTDSGSGYQSQAYRPYGTLVSGSWQFTGLRYGWTGREYDAELGWYYFRARYYDPGARRFVQEDPAGYGAGVNVYAYGNGNPLQGTDPSGMIFNPENVFNFNVDESVHSGPEEYLNGAPLWTSPRNFDPFASGSVSVFDGTTIEAEGGFLPADLLTNSEIVNAAGCSDDRACAVAVRILHDHGVVQGLRDALAESELDGIERGGYVLEDNGKLSLGPIVVGQHGEIPSSSWGPIPWDAIAMFHTHPYDMGAPPNEPMSGDEPPPGLSVDIVVGAGGVIAVGHSLEGYYISWATIAQFLGSH